MASTTLEVTQQGEVDVDVSPEEEISTAGGASGGGNDLSLGKDPKFLVGVAVSVYQNSGAALMLG